MTRQQRLDKLMSQGMNGYDAPPYYPSGAPYMDDFTLGEEPAPPPVSPWKVLGPVIAIFAVMSVLRML